ncbi:hypothetical protein AB6831_04035 [Carnobacterium divergens]|uniref:hypothetical protein n=1 Tax=Carnobacterium divergens TaxID=2748 RepID=UPI0039C94D96
MGKQIKDEHGNVYVKKKPFYKKWWVWIIVALLILFWIGSLGNSSENPSSSTSKSAKNTEEQKFGKQSNLLKDHKLYKNIVKNTGASDAMLVDEKNYDVNWNDNSWSGVNISIDKVSIIKVDNFKDYSDNEYQGFVLVHFNLDNTERDISIFPEQGTLVTDLGEQTEGNYEIDHWAGDILKGSKKEGYASYPLAKLDDVNEIKSIRLKWSGHYNTDDYDDNNSHKEYDVSIDLQ